MFGKQLFLSLLMRLDKIITAFLAGIGAELHLIIDLCMISHHLLHLRKTMIELTLLLRKGVGELGYGRFERSQLLILVREEFLAFGPGRLPLLLSLGDQSLELLIKVLLVTILVIVLLEGVFS